MPGGGRGKIGGSMAETLRVKELKSVFTPEQIAVRVRELGVEIDGLYGQEPLVAICAVSYTHLTLPTTERV